MEIIIKIENVNIVIDEEKVKKEMETEEITKKLNEIIKKAFVVGLHKDLY